MVLKFEPNQMFIFLCSKVHQGKPVLPE